MPKVLTEAAIRKQIAALQEKLKKSNRGHIKAVKAVTKLMAKHGISLDELRQSIGSKTPKGSKGVRRPAPVKYRDKNGNTWTGRGRSPLWLVAAEKAGHKRDEFLV